LVATNITATTLDLSWDPSTDNVGVVSYEVEQAVGAGAFSWLATVAAPTVTLAVAGLDPVGVYKFRVRAIDAAGNMSAWGPSDSGLSVDMFQFVAPSFNAQVRGMTPDGAGGYYVFGEFTTATDDLGTVTRNRICQLDNRGRITAWDPGSDQAVNDVVIVDADYVAVGKAYNATLTSNTLGGFDCRGFGLVHRTTGVAMSWDPAVLFTVIALAVDGDWLYNGRPTTTASSAVRRHSISANTLSTWLDTNNANNAVTDITVLSDGILCAGAFSSIGGGSRLGWAKVDKSSDALVAAFNASATRSLSSFAGVMPFGAGKLLVGGERLSALGAQTVKGCGIIDATTGAADAWEQDVAVTAATVDRFAFSTGKIAAASFANLRVYDAATGVTQAQFTAGSDFLSSASFGLRKFQFPRADRLIVFGQNATITADSGGSVASGTSRMFVLALT
jgi:hypothetical protein